MCTLAFACGGAGPRAKPAQRCPAADVVDAIEDRLGQGPRRACKRHGRWVFRYPSGRLAAEGSYSDGLRHGRWIFYRGDGSKLADGEYVDDVPDGYWMWFRDGKVVRRTMYVDGEPTLAPKAP